MRRYEDKKGGLSVDKYDKVKVVPEEKNEKIEETTNLNQKEVSISASDVIDTLQSYHSYSSNDTTSKGVCVICGKNTAYKNRHICVDCWKENCKNLIESLKEAVKEIDFEIK